MNISTAMLLVTLVSPAAPDTPSTRPDDSERLEIGWSRPRPEHTVQPALTAWWDRYQRQIQPVLSAWARMLRRLRGDLPALFDRQCTGLVASLEQLDEAVLLPVPDRLIDFYLKRLLLHLNAAGTACRRRELYNVVYRLEEARTNLGEIRWLLERKGLG